jgi:excinuclease ABC subunit B
VSVHERVIVTTLTKQMAEDLTAYLKERQYKAEYVHADILTLERSRILTSLRKGEFDVIVGVNLLREGLDLPEVSLVAILDADKEGFLRSKVSLIQTMGRAARHIRGEVILYADTITKSIKSAVDEVNRRREIQIAYNKEHHITPTTIQKPIRSALTNDALLPPPDPTVQELLGETDTHNMESLTALDKEKIIKQLRQKMQHAAKNMNFEQAATLRDAIQKLKE